MSSKDFKIFVECYTDEFFIGETIKGINISHKIIRHGANRPGVYELVSKYNRSLGLVDKDPGKTQSKSSIDNYVEIDSCSVFSLQQMKKDDNKLIVQVNPDIEMCFLSLAKQYRIQPSSYNLKDDFYYLHNIDARKNKDYQRFIIEIINKSNEINTLKKWIRDFR